jgi:hypothetical protein
LKRLLSRINDNQHDACDVVAVAILGTWVCYAVVHSNRHRRGEEERRHHGISDVRVEVLLSPEHLGLSFTWEW